MCESYPGADKSHTSGSEKMRCFLAHFFYAGRQQVICDCIKILKLETPYEIQQVFVTPTQAKNHHEQVKRAINRGVMHVLFLKGQLLSHFFP